MNAFDDIRAYRDDEVPSVLQRLLTEDGFLDAITALVVPRLRRFFPALARVLVRMVVRRRLAGVTTVAALQERVEPLLVQLIERTSSGVSYSGVKQLQQSGGALFMANHRDIVLDPALLNFTLYHHGHDTPYLAIGDNLVTRPWVGDLMRLNKSFLVKRSVEGRREKLKALSELSAYIHQVISLGHSAWIAQREGRAKDGNDQTDSAIIKMLTLFARSEKLTFSEALDQLHIVPVAISYEYNPCDRLMAAELCQRDGQGEYHKAPDEDLQSIRTGLLGDKGQIHVAFGQPLDSDQQALDAAAGVAAAVDHQIHSLYRLFPSNYFAFERMADDHPQITLPPFASLFPERDEPAERARFEQRLAECPAPHLPYWLKMYAMPVINKSCFRQPTETAQTAG